MIRDSVLVAQVTGFGLFLWFGCYLLTHVTRPRREVLVGIAGLFSLVAYFASSVLAGSERPGAELMRIERLWWWTALLPTATWYHFTTLVARRAQGDKGVTDRIRRTSLWLVYGLAALLIGLGTTTDLVINTHHGGPAAPGMVATKGPAYGLVMAFQGGTAAGAIFWLAGAISRLREHHPEEREQATTLKLLLVSACCFLFGALWLTRHYEGATAIALLAGYLALAIGLSGVGYGVARWGMLLEGQDNRRDLGYSFTAIALLNSLYAALLVRAGLEIGPSLLLLVGLVTVSHATIDHGRALLDRFFFPRMVRQARAEARAYAMILATDPVVPVADPPRAESKPLADPEECADEPTAIGMGEKEFNDAVRKAITGLKTPPHLARSPLLALALVAQRATLLEQGDHRLSRATALRELLIEHVEALRPSEGSPVGDAWRFYNVLHYPYVQGVSRKGALREARRLAASRRQSGVAEPSETEQILDWLADVDENTFYKWQRRASDTIALALWEAELQLQASGVGQISPTDEAEHGRAAQGV